MEGHDLEFTTKGESDCTGMSEVYVSVIHVAQVDVLSRISQCLYMNEGVAVRRWRKVAAGGMRAKLAPRLQVLATASWADHVSPMSSPNVYVRCGTL